MMNSTDPTCPRCSVALQPERASFGTMWQCPACNGRAVGLPVLRELFTADSINPLWLHAIEGKGRPGGACPSCRNVMTEVGFSDASAVGVDVCRLCQFVWFDVRELDRLNPRPLEEIKTLPEGARELMAMARLDQIAREETSRVSAECWQRIATWLVSA